MCKKKTKSGSIKFRSGVGRRKGNIKGACKAGMLSHFALSWLALVVFSKADFDVMAVSDP